MGVLHLWQNRNQAGQDFDILEAFAALEPKTRLMVCEQLFAHGQGYFKNTVRTLWPHASDRDARRLEKFLLKYQK
jgi:hypothetical protein